MANAQPHLYLPLSYAAQVTYATGARPDTIVAADVNGDGNLDLITANTNDNTISVLIGNGNGTFTAQVTYATGEWPHHFVASDIDKDGDVDLVIANAFDNTVSVLLGNGNGTFAGRVNYATESFPRSVTAADVDGDGNLDLITANLNSNSVSVLLGNGDGTFDTQIPYTTGPGPYDVTAADVNADGNLDLIAPNISNHTVSVLIGNGDGTFAAQTAYAAGTSPDSVVAADVNWDGKIDLITANNNSANVSVLLGNGDGTFQAQTTYAAGSSPAKLIAADINGDGNLDLIATNTTNTISVLLGNGNGAFAAPIVYTFGFSPGDVDAADLNGDGLLDLFVTNPGLHSLSVLLNTVTPPSVAFTEDAAAVTPFANASIADGQFDTLSAGAGNYEGATLTFVRHAGANAEDVFAGSGTLTIVNGGNVTCSGTVIGTASNSGGTLTITFNDNATTALVNAAIKLITYSNSSNTPPASVQIDCTINDHDASGALSDTMTATVSITAVNDVPVITSNDAEATPSVNLAENSYAVTTVVATDGEGDTLTYAITGGDDADSFTLNATTGKLYLDAPDFDAPTDADHNNSYIVEVTVSDGHGGADVQTITVNVIEAIENVIGSDGNDVFAEDSSADRLYGLAGNDTYFVGARDIVIENANKGTDTVKTGLDGYTLGDNVENLTLTGSADINGTGNALANILTGNNGNNILDGGAGNDTMTGGAGNDTYVVDNVSDIASETVKVGKKVVDAGGSDTVEASVSYSLGAYLEDITLTGTDNLNSSGNLLANTLTGNSGNNTLNGGAGTDTYIGGLGDDTYVLDNAGELALITELADAGSDTLNITYVNKTKVAASITLDGSLSEVENIVLTGTGLYNLTGNALNNTFFGNASANTMTGGDGDDTYVVGTGDTVVEANNPGAGTDTVQSSTISPDLANYANVENLILTGKTALNLTGNHDANVLVGNDGANILDGKGGIDNMIGGLGSDTYIVDDTNDAITEAPGTGSGTDLVKSSVDFILSANVENLTLTGSSDINGTGNVLANILTGNNGNNILDGGAGKDTMAGGAGNDTYVVDNVSDIASETVKVGKKVVDAGGSDTVEASVSYTLSNYLENLTLTGIDNLSGSGNALANTITGNSGNNTLNGGAGTDTYIGGLGDDTYVLDNAGELALITELADEGSDTITIAYANKTKIAASITLDGTELENITLTGTGLYNLTGNVLDNTFFGNASANTMTGGDGNDTYIIDKYDTVVEDGVADSNYDTVQSSTISLDLANYANVENLKLTGKTALNLTGNYDFNILVGNDGANILDGKGGVDDMYGGLGNDTYIVDGDDDWTIEDANAGTDLVMSSASFTLSDNVENLTLSGSGSINGTGNVLANILTGNSGNNVLNGGTGNDTMTGGLGNDTLFGGDGDDIFVFNTALTKGMVLNVDTIQSFVVGDDIIRLENAIFTKLTQTGTLAATAFASGDGLTSGADAADRIILNTATGDVYYDADGSGAIAAVQFATLTGISGTLTAADFTIV